jgi:hypothetical protein
VSRTHLRPDHIGEPLVSALIQQLKVDQRLDQLTCRNLLDGVDSTLEQVLKANAVESEFTVHYNVRLKPLLFEKVEYGFDGMSRVDCVIYGNTAFGVEIKLGMKKLTATDFTSEYCSPCGYTSHPSPRICGNMIAVLDGRFQQDTLKDVPLSVEIRAGVSSLLANQWGLVVRQKVIDQWTRNDAPILTRPCWVIAFEDFVPAVGGPNCFNDIVLKLVGDDFVGAWGLG